MHASGVYRDPRRIRPAAVPTSYDIPRPMPSSEGTSSAFRSSLRKLPSSFFTSKENVSKENRERRAPPLPLFPVVSVDKAESKRHRARRGLGEIFGFGNSTHRAPNPPPHVPAKDYSAPHDITTLLSKRDSAKSGASTASQSTLSLPRAQLAVAQGRMSMGEDPFGREEAGAVIVQMVSRHGAAPSNRSSGTPSTSSDHDAFVTVSLEPAPQKPSSVCDPRGLMPLPETLSGRHPAFPAAAARIAEPVMIPSATSPRPAAISAESCAPMQRPPPRRNVVIYNDAQQSLQRDKTKSRVWGFLGGGGKRTNKLRKQPSKASPLRDESYIKINLTHKDDEVKTRLQYSVGARSPIEDPFAAPPPGPAPATPPGITLPASHILKPSQTGAIGEIQPLARPFNSLRQHRRPSVTPTKMSIHRKPVPKVRVDESSLSPSVSSQQLGLKSVNNIGPPPRLAARPNAPSASAKPVPKRKSLTGLFGLKVKQSLDKLLPHGKKPLRGRCPDSVAPKVALPKLESFAEEMDLAFRRNATATMTLTPNSGEKSLRRAASATDRLLDLFKTFQFTPSPEFKTRHRDQHGAADLLAGQTVWEASPTPTRRSSSAGLAKKDVRSMAAAQAVYQTKHTASNGRRVRVSPTAEPTSVAALWSRTTCLSGRPGCIATGTPSPTRAPYSRPATPGARAKATPPQTTANAQIDRAKLIKRITPPPEGVEAEAFARMFSDIPFELQKLICPDLVEPPTTIVEPRLCGLPPPPRPDRNAPRRNARAAPAISLPPPPNEFATPGDRQTLNRETPDAPRVATQWTPAQLPISQGGGAFVLSESMGQNGEFDFAEEMAWMNDGNHRASFVETVQAVSEAAAHESGPYSAPPILSDSPLRVPRPLSTIEQSPDTKSDSSGDRLRRESSAPFASPISTEDVFQNANGLATATSVPSSPVRSPAAASRQVGTPQRKAPFQGQFAFQQHVSKTANASTSIAFLDRRDQDSPLPIGAPPTTSRQRTHHRDESGLSIATMSSIGAVIETGIAGEYTNHFEVNFADDLASSQSSTPLEDTPHRSPEVPARLPREAFTISPAQEFNCTGSTANRPETGRQRASSIVSIDSIKHEIDAMLAGPPVGLHNRNKSDYFRRRGRAGSHESSWGRADWAAHRRGDSSESLGSLISVGKLVRPGLGDRMFQRQADDTTAPPQGHSRASSTDSMFDSANNESYSSMFDKAEQSFNSMFDSQEAITATSDSFFSPLARAPADSTPSDAGFMLKSRPVSDVSTASGESTDDAALDPYKYVEKIAAKRSDNCLQAHGELSVAEVMTLGGNVRSDRLSLNTSFSRPPKPVGTRRFNPSRPVFDDSTDMSTPGLASPSTSDVSSRLSLLSRLSDAPTSHSWSGKYAKPAGHTRQKSSLAYELGTFARHEPSQATLRAEAQRDPGMKSVQKQSSQQTLKPEPMVVSWDEEPQHTSAISPWLHLQREAESVCRLDKGFELRNSKQSLDIPMTKEALTAFLAQSHDRYRPLDQLPVGERMTHKKKTSFTSSRVTKSPYGLPVASARRKSPAAAELEGGDSSSLSAPRPLEDHAALGGSTMPSTKTLPGMTAITNPPANVTRLAVASKAGPRLQVAIPRDADAFGLRQISQAAANIKANGNAPPSAMTKKPLSLTGSLNTEKTDPIGRQRLNSEDRRAALGWGRRRDSDGPTQGAKRTGVERGAPVSKIPVPSRNATGATFPRTMTKSLASGMKENAYVLAGPRPLVTHSGTSARLSNRTPSRVRPTLRA